MKLYEISEEFESKLAKLHALEEANAPDAELEALAGELISLEEQRDEKAANCCAYVKNMEEELEAIERAITKLTAKKKAMASRIDNFLGYMSKYLNGVKWTNGVHKIGWRESRAVKILDESLIPVQYKTEKVTYSPDKKAIMVSLEQGVAIPGCEIERRNNIQVK